MSTNIRTGGYAPAVPPFSYLNYSIKVLIICEGSEPSTGVKGIDPESIDYAMSLKLS